MIDKGRLAAFPLPKLLLEISRGRHTGALTLRAGGARRRLLFLEGSLAAVERTPDGILERGAAHQELSTLAQTADGGFDWKDEAVTVDAPVDIVVEKAAVEMVLRDTPIEHIGREIYALTATYRCDPALLGTIQSHLDDREADVLRSFKQPVALSTIFERIGTSERTRRVVVAAALAGALTSKAPAPAPPPPPPPPPAKAAAPAPPRAGTSADALAEPPPTPEQLREMVLAKRRTLAQSNHYQALEVPRDGGARVIEDHYVGLLRRYHPDAYPGEMDAETKDALEEIFARINEAYRVLSHAGRRAEYDELLRQGIAVKRELTEEDIMLAKSQLDAGRRLLDEGDWLKARSAFEAARRLNPESGEILGYLGRAYVEGGQANRMLDHAADLLTRALDLEPDRAVLHAFMGDCLRAKGDAPAAVRFYQQAMTLDRDLPQVSRALQELKAHVPDAGGGLLGGLFRGRKK